MLFSTQTSRGMHMAIAASLLAVWAGAASGQSYTLKVFPAEHKTMTDPETGTELTFLTTAPSSDLNLYFHERSWLADSSLILFTSDREDGGLMGYLAATGELVQIRTPQGGVGAATAAVDRNSVYGLRGNDVVELGLTIHASADPASAPSVVEATERVICTFSEGGINTALNPNADGTRLAAGASGGDTGSRIVVINIASGAVTTACTVGDPPGYAGHIQWSHTDPNLLSFAANRPRLNVVDVKTGRVWSPYVHLEGELVTHEHWWVDDQIVFCGGMHPKPTEDAHVKVVNIYTGVVRIIGTGAWWPDATPEAISKQNHWHCSGSDDGQWVASDNWHGDITLFEGKTARRRDLTHGHRTYGRGVHPHVGWDRKGEQVVFTSHMLGDPNVCVATIPDKWQKRNR